MKLINLISGKPTVAVAVALLGAASLVACGRGGDNLPPPPVPTPTPTVDAFYAAVLALVANSPEDTEPVDCDGIIATAPEDTEPQPLG